MSLEVKPVSAGSALPQPVPASAVAGAPAPQAALSVQEPQPPQPPSSEDLRRALQAVAERLKPAQTNLSFRVDDTLNRVIVSIVDAETGAVLRQIPAEELLRVAQNLQQYMGGLVDEVA